MPFLEVYVLLPAFSRCSVSNDLHVDFFFDVFVGEGECHVLLCHRLDPLGYLNSTTVNIKMRVSFQIMCFLGIYVQEWDCWIMW